MRSGRTSVADIPTGPKEAKSNGIQTPRYANGPAVRYMVHMFDMRCQEKGLTPYEFICKPWAKEPERFRPNTLQQMPGRNT